ncbi:MAG: LytTR family DNA-binding domain-containing protein [Bryobacteraceae bacterium]|nr:LytTR family DNA-binding domain-containing protein [Bryobacteraceae bacterium]
MEAIKALIVDDEALSRRRIRRLLTLEQDVTIAGECADAASAVEALARTNPDLLFLDIQMPRGDGFAVLERAGVNVPRVVVFVTAHDDYAVRAFEVHAFDYLLKPFDRKRFHDTVERARIQLRQSPSGELGKRLSEVLSLLGSRTEPEGRIPVRCRDRILLVNSSDIDWIESADNYVCLHCGPVTHVLRETMNSLEGRLRNRGFVRIHRSTMVNSRRIRELHPLFHGDHVVILADGSKPALSRNYYDRLKAVLFEI